MEQHRYPTIGYLSGPVDGKSVYNGWKNQTDLDYFGSSYLLQFMAVTHRLGQRLVVTTRDGGEPYTSSEGHVTVMNRPRVEHSGVLFHYHQIRWLWARVREMARAGARIIVLTDSQLYWWMLLPWRLRDVRFVNALHCTVYRPFHQDKPSRRFFNTLLRWFHFSFGDVSLAASPLIVEQLHGLSRGRIAADLFLPSYDRSQFARIDPPAERDSEYDGFHVMFAGRVEKNKGVFDLIDIARRLTDRPGPRLYFHICGDGTCLGELRAAIALAGLDDRIRTYGFCKPDEMVRHFSTSHAVIVPTRSSFEEGFAMIVAEGVIAGRPVVTSRVCPALALVEAAAVEVEPDDVGGYADALWRLATDKAFYQSKIAATLPIREQFFDLSNSYGDKLLSVLTPAT